MVGRVSYALLVVSLMGLPANSSATAQEFHYGQQMDQLMRAMEQQNARILQLERELQQQRAAQQLQQQRGTPSLPANFRYRDDTADGGQTEAAKRFEEIEKELGDLGETLDGITGDKTYVHSGTSKSTLIVGGRVHLDAWAFSNTSGAISQFEGTQAIPVDPQNRIAFRRIRFGVKGNVTDNMNYKIEMDFASPRSLAYKDVYLGWTDLAFFQTVLLGNQKRPYGLDHMNSSRYNVFVERPFVIEAFNQDARRIGLAAYGFSENEAFNWRYGVYQLADTAQSGGFIDDSLQLELAGRFANTIWYDEVSGGRGYAHWALSGTFADPDGTAAFGQNQARFLTRPEARSTNRWLNTGRIAGADTYGLLGVEGVVNVGSVQLVGEYQNVWLSRMPGFGNDVFFNGGYVYVSYFLTGEHMPWNRQTGTLARIKPFQNFWFVRTCDGGTEKGWGAWQLAARYSKGDYTDNDVFGGVGESFTFGLNWYWNANARVQFNYLSGRIDQRFASLESGDYGIFGARFMIDF